MSFEKISKSYLYRCLRKNAYQLGDYVVEAVHPQHIERIRQWRNQQTDVLRQVGSISKEDQISYFANYVWPEMDRERPERILLALKLDDRLIGYGGLVHISWENLRGEISFLLDTKIANTDKDHTELFPGFLRLIKILSFEELSLNRIYGELFDLRPGYRKALIDAGFDLEGTLKGHSMVAGSFVDSLIYGIINDDYDNSLHTKIDHPNVLITSISQKVPLIRSVKSGVEKIDRSINVFGGDSNSLCIAKYFVDEFWEMPSIDNLTKNHLINFCIEKKVGLIIPTRDGELEYFSAIKDKLKQKNIAVMISTKDSIISCLDKLKFAQLQGIHGLPTSENIEDIEAMRFVVKERFGAGGRKIGLDLNKRDALEYGLALVNPVFQPFIEGDEISVDAYVARDGNVKGLIMRRRDLVIAGESQVTTTFRDSHLEIIFTGIVESLNLYGHVNLQANIVDDNHMFLIECNPRFGGASTLSVQAGLDPFFWVYLEAMGYSLEKYPFKRSHKEVAQVRHPEDLYL